jgi:hypothetical protein
MSGAGAALKRIGAVTIGEDRDTVWLERAQFENI